MLMLIIKIKIAAWCKKNEEQAKEFWEIKKLIKAWAFFNREIKHG